MTTPKSEAYVASPWVVRLSVAMAGWAGASTLSYEMLWFRVLTYLVDTSIGSFAIMLTAFLCGLATGSALVPRLVDSKRDPVMLLGSVEVGIGVSGILSVPVIARTSKIVLELDRHVGSSFGAEAAVRLLAFALALLVPTALMGSVLPVIARIGVTGRTSLTRIGHAYGTYTAGGALGSLASGFIILPLMGVQKGITLLGLLNVVLGVATLSASRLGRSAKIQAAFGCAAIFGASFVAVRPDAVATIYSQRYAPPKHELLYLNENVNGTTAVFREVGRGGTGERRYLVIDGRGEVSTDYLSMRAFRLLALLPAFYSTNVGSALIVTFGSGIVAGSIASLPEVRDADCVEICGEAFNAARYFAAENHDVLENPKIHFVVNDGRNHLLTTPKAYDIISADATHPTSGDSWVLYTKEFYELCAGRLTDGGIMSQWMPMHGIREADFRILLKTFHSAFPFVAVYYAGGYKAAGHLILLGSKKPLRIDVPRAEALFADDRVRQDLKRVNVLSLPDMFNCFMFGEEAVDSFAGDGPLNTDDRPIVAFSASDAASAPNSWLASIARYRRSIYPHLYGMSEEVASGVEQGLRSSFDATGYAIEGQVLEAQEYAWTMALDVDHPDQATRAGLERSRAMLEQVVAKYRAALQTNPEDSQTRYLLFQAVVETRALEDFLNGLRGSPSL